MSQKECRKCKETKDITEFYLRAASKDGRGSYCKICSSVYRKDWRYNPDKAHLIEASNQRDIERHRDNPLYKEQQRRYSSSPLVRRKKQESHNNRLLVDILYLLRCRLRQRVNKAVKENSKKGSAVKDLGCSIAYFKEYLEAQFETGMSWDNYGKGDGTWSIDHIMPLSLFDLNNEQHFVLAACYLNQRPMWSKENFRKSAKIPYELLRVA